MTDPHTQPLMTEEQDNHGLARLRLVLWIAVAVFAIAGAVLFIYFANNPEPQQSADYADSVGGPFALTAPDGSTVTDETLKGQPYAIFFGFTRCPDVCPTTLSRLARLRAQMGADGDKFRIVFVSVDAGRDTPEDVGRYVDLFGTPILGLTGNEEQIARIVDAYHVYFRKVPVEGGDYTIDHSAAVFLMDREGQLQSIIDHHEGGEASLEKLERLVS